MNLNELLPPSSTSGTTHHPPPESPLAVENTISPCLTSGPTSTHIGDASRPQNVWKISKLVEKLRKKLGKILSSPVLVARRATPSTIDILPEDVLLQIFYFCRVGEHPLELPVHPVLEWHRQIHVCRRWRQIILSSPRRLDLYLLCKQGTPVRKNLGLWPAFPIIVHYGVYPHRTPKLSSYDEDNIIAALEHPDRVRRLKIPVTNSLLGKVAEAPRTQEPFPMLTQLWLSSELEGGASNLSRVFLGIYAPRLREIHLEGILFPTLPTLLSSAADLVNLSLHRIPHLWFIPSEVIVASLATLTRLLDLSIEFQQSTSRPNQSTHRRRAAPPMRVVLPVLTSFGFQGDSEYLEDLVAQIDAPSLASIRIKCVDQHVFQVPQLFRVISQTQIIEQACTIKAEVHFHSSLVKTSLALSRRIFLELQISCRRLDRQVLHLAEVLSQSSMVLSTVQHLFIAMYSSQPDDVDNVEWLALLRRFNAVQTLLVSHRVARHIADALNGVTAAMAPEILPALRLLHLVGEGAGCVEDFIAMRRLSGFPPVTLR